MMAHVFRVALPGVLALATACALSTQPASRLVSFNSAEYAPYDRPGTGVIFGQVFLRTQAGEVRYGAGSEVYLDPVTSYSTEWWTRAVVGGRHLEPADAKALAYRKTSVADGEGRFVFPDLPAGEYYVVSSVFWEYVASGWTTSSTGSMVGQRVRLGDNRRADLVLNDVHTTIVEGRGAAPSIATLVREPQEVGNSSVSQRAEPAKPNRESHPPRPASAATSESSRLTRHTGFRFAVGDAIRQGIVLDYREEAPGIVILGLAPAYSTSMLEFHLERIHRAYGDYLYHSIPAVLELWLHGDRLGEYSNEGLVIGPPPRPGSAESTSP
jgi:hypothetical protein